MTLRAGALAAAVLAALACAAPALAAPGDPDPTFGDGGFVRTDFPSDAGAESVVVRPDGRIVAAGAGPTGFALAAYTTAGQLDTSFNGTGRAVTTFPPASFAVASALALGPGGRVVAAGFAGTYAASKLAFAVYRADGTPDPDFNGSGRLVLDPGGTTAQVTGLDVAADGRITYVATLVISGQHHAMVGRMNPDGSADASFNTGNPAFPDPSLDLATGGVAVGPDGRIHVAITLDGTDAGQVVLTGDGKYDDHELFGYAVGSESTGAAILVQGDGRAVIAGTAKLQPGPTQSFGVAMVGLERHLEAAFSSDGRVVVDTGSASIGTSLLGLPDGRFVVAGQGPGMGAARLEHDGTRDVTFGAGGVAGLIGPNGERAFAWALDPHGDYVAAGDALVGGHYVFAVARMLGDRANLAVTAAAPARALRGAPVSVTLTVTNAGPQAARDVVLDDELPAGTTLASAAPSSGSCTGGGPVSCRLGSLPAGGSATVVVGLAGIPAAAPSPLSHRASVRSAVFDPAAGDDAATSSTVVSTRLKLRATLAGRSLATLRRRGVLTVKATVDRPAKLAVVATAARRTLGKGRSRARRAGTTAIKVRLGRKARAALPRHGRLKLKLVVTARSADAPPVTRTVAARLR